MLNEKKELEHAITALVILLVVSSLVLAALIALEGRPPDLRPLISSFH